MMMIKDNDLKMTFIVLVISFPFKYLSLFSLFEQKQTL